MDKLNELLDRNVSDPIDAVQVSEILAQPPFVQVEGLINPRDLNDGSLTTLKQGFAYRSGSLEVMTLKGREQLRALDVKKIIDLRSAEEVAAFPNPHIEGITTLATNTNRDWNRNEGDIGAGKFAAIRFDTVLANLYVKMIETNPGTFRDLLLHVRDNGNEPFLFHCTAGKDRTGAAAGLLLALAGAPADYVSHDFGLTRLGFEPFRELLALKLTGGKPVDLNDEAVKWKMETFGSSKAEVMTAFLENIDEKYTSVDECVKKVFDFEDGDVETIKMNLAAS